MSEQPLIRVVRERYQVSVIIPGDGWRVYSYAHRIASDLAIAINGMDDSHLIKQNAAYPHVQRGHRNTCVSVVVEFGGSITTPSGVVAQVAREIVDRWLAGLYRVEVEDKS